jgi:hypothetical protein
MPIFSAVRFYFRNSPSCAGDAPKRTKRVGIGIGIAIGFCRPTTSIAIATPIPMPIFSAVRFYFRNSPKEAVDLKSSDS